MLRRDLIEHVGVVRVVGLPLRVELALDGVEDPVGGDHDAAGREDSLLLDRQNVPVRGRRRDGQHRSQRKGPEKFLHLHDNLFPVSAFAYRCFP